MTGDSAVTQPEQFTYQAEMQQLLDLIIHSLYQHKDIFLRELISNASDALNKVRYRLAKNEPTFDDSAELEIELKVDAEAKTLTVSDRGVGMTREQLIENLGTIARSGTKGFLSQLKEQKEKAEAGQDNSQDLIGQFGVGFYSAFMVAEKITVLTRSAEPEAKAWLWTSDGSNSYSIEEAEKDSRGTDITIYLKDEDETYAKDYKVRSVVKHYSNYVSYPIKLGEDQLNQSQAIWCKNKNEVEEKDYHEFYRFVSGNFDEPMSIMHLSSESPVQFHSLLFIPSQGNPHKLFTDDETGLKLYCRKVFVHEKDAGLLPHYLRFICGVVDSEDFPLNVSREVVQSNPMVRKISKTLTKRVLTKIERMAKNDMDKFKTFWTQFGRVFKEGLTNDFERREQLTELIHFESNKEDAGELTTLARYVDRMPEEQPQIYYVSAENRATALKNPKLEIFQKHNVEVLLFLDPIDEFVMSNVPKYKEKDIVELDKADLSWLDMDDSDAPKVSEDDMTALIEVFKAELGEAVKDVRTSERLVESPCALVTDEAMSRHMERMMKMMNKDFQGAKRVLELNPKSEIIHLLNDLRAKDIDADLMKTCIQQLFDNVTLIEGELETFQNVVSRGHELMVRALKAETA